MTKITHLVVHYSATYADQNLTVRDIDKMHRDRGWQMVGYHYVIRRDGTVERGRPDTMVGAHVANQNTGKLGICWIGGLDRATGPNKGVDNRTEAQTTALIALLRELLKKYPGAKVVGHRDLAPTQCPGFDVPAWWAKVQKKAAPEPKPADPKAPAKTGHLGEQKSHIVQKGETWWSISQMYGLGIADLARANGASPADTLAAGRELTLVIPARVVEVGMPVPVPVVPEAVEQEAQKAERRGWWQWPSAGVLALIGGLYRDYPELAWAATGGVVVIGVVALIGGRGFVRRVKDLADEVRG